MIWDSLLSYFGGSFIISLTSFVKASFALSPDFADVKKPSTNSFL
jgi:hypothetical protein